jgi:hypothetical protein
MPENPARSLEISRLVESYRTSEQMLAERTRLGAGRYGIPILETDPATNERIAVKHVPGATDRAQLIREVESSVRLRHPRIIRIIRWQRFEWR